MIECTPEDLEKWARQCESLSSPRLIEAEGYRMAARTISALLEENRQLKDSFHDLTGMKWEESE